MGEEAKDKLTMRYQRYFFKEGKEMEKVQHANDLVDLAFQEGFEIFGKAIKAEKKVDKILDSIKEKEDEIDFGKGTIDTTGRPYDHPKKVRVVADVEECGMMGGGPMNKGISDIEPMESEDEYMDTYDAPPNDGENEIDHVPNQDAEELYASVRKQLGENTHLTEAEKSSLLKFFTSQLKKFKNADSEIDPDMKAELGKTVAKRWQSKKMMEWDLMTEGDKEAYKAYFQKMLKKYGVSSPDQLGDKKKEFFNTVDKGWKAKKESD